MQPTSVIIYTLEPSITISDIISVIGTPQSNNEIDTVNRTPLILGTTIPGIVLILSIIICIGICCGTKLSFRKKKKSTKVTENHPVTTSQEHPRYHLYRNKENVERKKQNRDINSNTHLVQSENSPGPSYFTSKELEEANVAITQGDCNCEYHSYLYGTKYFFLHDHS